MDVFARLRVRHRRRSRAAIKLGRAWLLLRGLVRQMTGGDAVIDAPELSHDAKAESRTKHERAKYDGGRYHSPSTVRPSYSAIGVKEKRPPVATGDASEQGKAANKST